MRDELTPKQTKFCQEYLVDLNATQAALRSGYSEKTCAKIGWENLQKPEIQAELTRLRTELAKDVVSPEWVLEKLKQNVDRAFQAEPVLDNNGDPIGEFRWEGSVANKALELIGKTFAMFTDKQETQSNVEHSIKDDTIDKLRQTKEGRSLINKMAELLKGE